MKRIEAIIRKTKFDEVKEALLDSDINWFEYHDVHGIGQSRQERIYRGVVYNTDMIERVALTIICREVCVDNTINVLLGGLVFGISQTEVTPPATAARDSEKISALWVSPGSRKCTWVSINPGNSNSPEASNSSSMPERLSLPLPYSIICAIRSSSTSTEPLKVRPSLTTIALEISVLCAIMK